MKYRLLWKLCVILALGAVALLGVMNVLSSYLEQQMSYLDEKHRQELLTYGETAKDIFNTQGEQALGQWIRELQEKENTWVAVVSSEVKPLAETVLPENFVEENRFGRSIDWKIHLYFDYNPVMDVPFGDGIRHFLIQLPQRMRPGGYLPYIKVSLEVLLPLILLSLVCWLVYRHLMTPLNLLKVAAGEFGRGEFDMRIKSELGKRNDELMSLASAFDEMAERTSELIVNQRHLLSDLSHELRAPLSRLDMAVEYVEQESKNEQALARLKQESATMRQLIEDTLMLARLVHEKPQLVGDTFDLVDLIQVICEDARFEYSDRALTTNLPHKAVINNSSQRALSHALENIIRNALYHTPKKSEVHVSLEHNKQVFVIKVIDQGTGVPENLLTQIFQPFFQVDVARKKKHGKGAGFGLGLALAYRQIEAVGGLIKAENYSYENTESSEKQTISGLLVTVILPLKNQV